MKKVFVKAAVALAMMTVVACGGGGGNTSTGGVYFTHSELAQEFVRRVNVDVWGYDLSLVKTNTLQFDYIVVYDHYYGTYDAYYIGNYNPGENLSSYLNNYSFRFYYDLIPESGNNYYDPVSGLLFEKVQPSSKNLSKMKAFKEELAITKKAEDLRAQFGMSEEKALDTARFAYKIKSSPAGTYNAKDFDAFAKELTGSTITEFQKDLKSNNAASLDARIEKAAQVTGMGTEGVEKMMKEIFGK